MISGVAPGPPPGRAISRTMVHTCGHAASRRTPWSSDRATAERAVT